MRSKCHDAIKGKCDRESQNQQKVARYDFALGPQIGDFGRDGRFSDFCIF